MSHEDRELFDRVFRALEIIDQHLHRIMASQSDLAKQIADTTAELQKIGAETSTLLQKITDLQAVIDAGAAVTPELQAAVDALVAQAKVVDDLVPDAPPVS